MMPSIELVLCKRGWQEGLTEADTFIVYRYRRTQILAILPAQTVALLIEHHLHGLAVTAELTAQVRTPLPPNQPRLRHVNGRPLRGWREPARTATP